MKTILCGRLASALLSVVILTTLGWAQPKPAVEPSNAKQQVSSPLITFIELGSVNCIPCKQMQPIMASIEKKYADQVKVVFYDVWKPETRHYAQTYGIRLIPTQVFLDKEGNEVFRHEGFFPEPEIDVLLEKHGLKILVRR